jgi:hypothetical protein
VIDHLHNLAHISAADAERDPAPLSFDRRRPSRSTAELLARIERQMEVVRMWQAAQKKVMENRE